MAGRRCENVCASSNVWQKTKCSRGCLGATHLKPSRYCRIDGTVGMGTDVRTFAHPVTVAKNKMPTWPSDKLTVLAEHSSLFYDLMNDQMLESVRTHYLPRLPPSKPYPAHPPAVKFLPLVVHMTLCQITLHYIFHSSTSL
jgi:hypothetical protein